MLLAAHGAAAGLEDVPAYLREIRGGRPAPAELVETIRERYRRMGGKSPLLEITLLQAAALETALRASHPGIGVYVGMRHSKPTIREAVARIRVDGRRRVVFLPLTPYASEMSTGAYLRKYKEAVVEENAGFSTLEVGPWNEHPLYLGAWSAHVREGLSRFPEDARAVARVVFTAHSLPSRALKGGDRYPAQLLATAAAVAGSCGLRAWEFAYQSRGAGDEPWLGPDAGAVLLRLSAEGCRHVLLAPIGFLSDHMETLYDDDVLYRERALSLGLAYERVRSLNADPLLIAAMSGLVLERLGRAAPVPG